MTRLIRCIAQFACSLVLLSCDGKNSSEALAEAGSPPASATSSAAAAASIAPKAAPKGARHALSNAEFTQLFTQASEADEYFFSDNYVSNETSYLQVAAALKKQARPGGAYLGVGPEQNFSYLALLEPELAFIVDIRRANAVEHLWYKALFEAATSRVSFLAALIGRAAPRTEQDQASLAEIIEHVEALPRSEAGFERVAAATQARIAAWGIQLSKSDLKVLHATQRAFFENALTLSFELHEKNGRTYPTLRALLLQKDPTDQVGGFLASAAAFKTVQRMQRENRVIPIVGNFAGEHALVRIAQELKRRQLPVHTFYVSNVEQYLLKPELWSKWASNVSALPSNETSVFIRCYLDQGKRHPQQLKGHRTATVISSFDHFKWRGAKRPYKNFFEIATDGVLAE